MKAFFGNIFYFCLRKIVNIFKIYIILIEIVSLLIFLSLLSNEYIFAASVKVKVSKAFVYEKAQSDSSIIATVPAGTILEYELIQDGWYKVNVKYKNIIFQGYIRKEDVTEIFPSAEVSAGKKITEEVPKKEFVEKEATPPKISLSEETYKQIIDKLNKDPFYSKKRLMIASFEEKKRKLQNAAIDLEKENQFYDKQIKKYNSRIAKISTIKRLIKEAVGTIAIIFFPGLKYFSILSIFGVTEIILLIFLPIFLFNIIGYLIIIEKEFFKKRKKIIILVLILILFFFYLPKLYGEESKQKDTLTKFGEVNVLLKMTIAERAIKMLEKKPYFKITLPEIPTSNAYLKPWKIVRIDYPEYYFTLASLYYEVGRKGKAIDILKKLFEINFIEYPYNKSEYQQMLINLTKFFIEIGMREAGVSTIERILPIAHNINVLLPFADYLYQKNLRDSATKILRQSIFAARNTKELLRVIETIIDKRLYPFLNDGINRYFNISRYVDDYIILAKLLLNRQLDEQLVFVLGKAIDNFQDKESLMAIADFAIKEELFEQAIKSIEKILSIRKDYWKYPIASPDILPVCRLEPIENDIFLSSYLGIIYQKMDFIDKAEQYYEAAVVIDLDRVIESFGFILEGNANNLFYLKQLWYIKNEINKIKQLNPFYNYLQEQYLKELKSSQENQLNALSNKVEKLQNERIALLNKLLKLKKDIKKEVAKTFIHFMRLLAFSALIIIVAIGMIIKSVQAAKKASCYKFFALIGKLIEVSGWISLFSVIDLLLGIIKIIIGQFMQIFQKIQQDGEQRLNIISEPKNNQINIDNK